MTRSVQRAEPMVGTHEPRGMFQRSDVARHDDVERVVAFSRSQNLHDDFVRAREGAHALVLAHFVPPQLSEVHIDRGSGLLPVFENHGIAGPAIGRTNRQRISARPYWRMTGRFHRARSAVQAYPLAVWHSSTASVFPPPFLNANVDVELARHANHVRRSPHGPCFPFCSQGRKALRCVDIIFYIIY